MVLTKLLSGKIIGTTGAAVMAGLIAGVAQDVLYPKVKEKYEEVIERKVHKEANVNSQEQIVQEQVQDPIIQTNVDSNTVDHWWDYLLLGTKDFKEDQIIQAYENYTLHRAKYNDTFWLYYDKYWYHIKNKKDVIENIIPVKSESVITNTTPSVIDNTVVNTTSSIGDKVSDAINHLFFDKIADIWNDFLLIGLKFLLNEYVLFFVILTGGLIALRLVLFEIKFIASVIKALIDTIAYTINLFINKK